MSNKRSLAVAQLLLMLPSVLFMAALVMRVLRPAQDEPAYTAQRIIMWYAARMWTLWVLLLALPLAAVVTGLFTLLRRSQAMQEALAAIYGNRSMQLIAATTVMGATVLVIVILHMAAN